MELLEILKSACGKAENSESNSAITINLYKGDLNSENLEPAYTHTTHNPEVDIKCTGDYVIIDLLFRTEKDSDLQILWTILEKYGAMQSVRYEGEDPYACIITIVPKLYNGQYFINVANPLIWVLQSPKPGQPANVIRFMSTSDFLEVFETDDINLAEVDAEIEREVAEEERHLAIMAEKEAEREAFLQKRNDEFTRQRFIKK